MNKSLLRSHFNFGYLRIYLGLIFSFIFFSSFIKDRNENPEIPIEKNNDILKRRRLYQQLVSSGDPVFFLLKSNKLKVNQGEEVKLTISAHFLEGAQNTYLVDKELYGYTLRLILPEGFVVTGGDFQDLQQGKVSRQNNTQTYTVFGYFEQECSNCEFKLIRGTYNRSPSEEWIYKKSLILNVPEENVDRLLETKNNNYAIQPNLKISNLNIVAEARNVEALEDKPLLNAEFCTTNSYNVPAGSSETSFNSSCVRSISSPKWFIINVTQGGIMNFKLGSPSNKDIDFICYGPFTGITETALRNKSLTDITNTKIQDASYHPRALENCTWGYATPGNCNQNPTDIAVPGFYVLMISNYSKSATTIDINRIDNGVPGGAVTSCGEVSNPCVNSPSLASNNFQADQYGNVIAILGSEFSLQVSQCTSNIVWYKNGMVIAGQSGSTLNTYETGSYKISCSIGSCQGKVSNTLNLIYDNNFRITHNIPNNEVVEGIPFELRAVGCADGMVQWSTAGGNIRNDNPIWESAPGLYKARCIKDGNVFSDWISVFFTLRAATTPQISKPDQCFYANQKVYISGSCPAGMTLNWLDGTYTSQFPAYKEVTPGLTYRAQCCNGGGYPNNCGDVVDILVCTITPKIQQIVTDKDNLDTLYKKAYAAPNEPVLLTATGCTNGTVQWMYNEQIQYGNPITVYGPGMYYARCTVSDQSYSNTISREVFQKPVGDVSIITSQSTAFSGQLLTLTATGCNGGQVHWRYTVGSQIITMTGRTIDVTGPNTYYAKCITNSITGQEANINIPQASGLPKIIANKSRVRPNETFVFQVDFSACPNFGWPGGSTKVTQNGVTTNMWGWDPVTITGPAILEAYCANASWQKQTKEVFLAPGDNIRLVANKSKAKITETVLLTTYGCDYGYIEWKIGDNTVIGNMADPKREITQTGPGLYKARCKEDFNVNSEWVSTYVDIDGTIVPVINGPNSLCPNTAATLTTAGCPAGYYNAWSTLEQGGFTYGGNSVTVYLPQTVKLRCHKNDNSWTSDEKPFTIHSAIPDDIKATSNSPVVNGGTVQLAGTAVTGATYLWTPPAGVTLTVPLNTRTLQIPNVSAALAGEYKLQVTSGGCVVQVSTRVDVNLCDNLYIRAFDPLTGEDKTRLNRKTGKINEYDNLILQVENFDGDILKGVTYTWSFPQGITGTVDPTSQYQTTINKVGNYRVNVTSPGGISCPLEIDISALTCTTPTDFTNCGADSSFSITDSERLKNLAVGDEFTTYDYIVRVTEVSGSETSGWTGKGELVMNFLKIGSSPVVEVPLAVEFEGINLNQCYQLLAGPKVRTVLDPNWSNVVSVDDIIDKISKINSEISELLTQTNNKTALQNKITELENLKTEIATSSDLGFDFIHEKTTAITEVISTVSCYVGSPGARTANTCTAEDVEKSLEAKTISMEKFVSYREVSGGQMEFLGPGPDPIIFVGNLLFLQQVADEIEVQRKLNPSWSASKLYLESSWNVYKGFIHTSLDIAGLAPVAGEFADGVNAIIYLAEGDNTNAALSAISMVPVVGDGIGKGTKYTRKVVQWFKVGNRYFRSPARKAAYEALLNQFSSTKVADAIWDASNSKLIRKAVTDAGKALKVSWEAHHIIPREVIEQSPTLINAIKQGFEFNKMDNLLPLDLVRHPGSHGSYTTAVRNLVTEIERKLPSLSDKQKIEKAVQVITKKIKETEGKINLLTFKI